MVMDAGTQPEFTLESLQELNTDSKVYEVSKIPAIRYDALSEAALEVGAQGGFSSRASEIKKEIESNAALYDRSFPFSRLLIDGNILPPVILSSRQASVSSDNGKTLRLADATYKIKSDARFAANAPSWRDYLSIPSGSVSLPHESMTPKNDEEKALWFKKVKEGWEIGVQQATESYTLALRELKEDFTGMVTYRSLLSEGKVTKPTIKKRLLGVTGGGDEMAVGDRVAQITQDSSLQAQNSYEWKAAVLPKDRAPIVSPGSNVDNARKEIKRDTKAKRQSSLEESMSTWVSDWESKDTKAYLSHYSEHFALPVSSRSRAQWEKSRSVSIGNASVVKVNPSNVKIIMNDEGDSAGVTFDQYYQFGSTHGVVEKSMLFEKERGVWKIIYEAETSPRKRLK